MLALLVPTAAGLAAQQPRAPFSFVVLGHIRGPERQLNPRLGELLDRVRDLHPAFVVLTGDIIFGESRTPTTDSVEVEREWESVDSALATLGVPVHRVPGNHDISDLVTRNIYFRRYGRPPQAFSYEGSRFLRLSSAWIPPDGDSRKRPYIRGVDLDSVQVAFLKREVSTAAPFEHMFVFMHHLLWWESEDGRWWKEVHPILTRGPVRAVFSGDLGPLKFSYARHDGIDYYQTAIEEDPSLAILRGNEGSRRISAQFDNFLLVTVRGSAVDVEVKTTGAASSGHFSRAQYQAVQGYLLEQSRRPIVSRLWDLRKRPKWIAVLSLFVVAVFAAGAVSGAMWRRRRSRT